MFYQLKNSIFFNILLLSVVVSGLGWTLSTDRLYRENAPGAEYKKATIVNNIKTVVKDRIE